MPEERVDECDRSAAITRLRDLVSCGALSLEQFLLVLEQVFDAPNHTELSKAMSVLPPPITLTPPSRRLGEPLVLHVADGDLQLGTGWQLAAHTIVRTGFGSARLDLTAATWDDDQINLRLETWGSIEVLVPKGVEVQLLGPSGRVRLESLSPSVPGGPVLQISTSGPSGVIFIRHPDEHEHRPFMRWIGR